MYNCERCGYTTKLKTDFKRHLERQKLCPPNINDLPKEILLSKLKELNKKHSIFKTSVLNLIEDDTKSEKKQSELYENIYKDYHIKLDKTSINNDKVKKEIIKINDKTDDKTETIEKKIFVCPNCSETFTRLDNLKRHYRQVCNRIIEEKEIKDTLLDEYNKLKKENEELKVQTQKAAIIIHNTKNIGTNFENANIQQNNYQQNNIQLKAFGKENLAPLNNEALLNIIRNPEIGIPKLIKLLHFNPEYPENHNIVSKGKRSDLMAVYDGKKWHSKSKKDTIQNLIASKKDLADDYFEELGDDESIIDFLTKQKYEEYTDAIDKYINTICIDPVEKENYMQKYKRLYDRLFKQVNLILMNNAQLAKLKTRLENNKNIEYVLDLDIDGNKKTITNTNNIGYKEIII